MYARIPEPERKPPEPRKYELKPEHRYDFPAQLPEVKLRPNGPWVLVLVEPLPQQSSIIEMVESVYDENTSPGIGWVLLAKDHYYHVPPHMQGASKTPDHADMTHRYDMPVKRGDRILFRRFLKTQHLMQGQGVSDEIMQQFPDYEWVFLNVQDIIGIIRD
ncbi:MAG: hypothetical protein KDB07_02995 [Planctomycetes bacterium]|nr:hypothetical protein [Planctomycetota bacterium]